MCPCHPQKISDTDYDQVCPIQKLETLRESVTLSKKRCIAFCVSFCFHISQFGKQPYTDVLIDNHWISSLEMSCVLFEEQDLPEKSPDLKLQK